MNFDQPPPISNNSTPIFKLVLADIATLRLPADVKKALSDDIETRAELGLKRYGKYLQAGNTRSAAKDAYAEALDLVMYLRQELEEATARDGDLEAAYSDALFLFRRLKRRLMLRNEDTTAALLADD